MPTEGPAGTASWTVLKTLQWTADYFKRNALENPRMDAEILLAHTLQCRRIDLYVHHDQPLSEDELTRFRHLIKRRLNREPVAYIAGAKEFWSLRLQVNPAVLIPRPDTECLVETAMKYIPGQATTPPCRILELGVGSGAVTVALARERPACRYWAMDRSPQAVHIARNNARCHEVDHLVRFFAGQWLDAVAPGRCLFDMILSNPPYIPTSAIAALAPEIRCFEPGEALDGGPDGLREIDRIISQAHDRLKPGGVLLLEIGFDQRKGVEGLAQSCGAYEPPLFLKDYGGHDRVVHLKKRLP
jgi:release factor glutamine methyltransferase